MSEKPEIRFVLLLLMVFCFIGVELISAVTDSSDVAALQSLKNQWENLPPSWYSNLTDPCGTHWEGVTCNDSRVTAFVFSTTNVKGAFDNGDIGALSELIVLDLSHNRGLTGSLSPSIGNLTKLNVLVLTGCGLTGNIPEEIGKLTELTFLALNSNYFTGTIPPILGSLSKLYWFDLADNQLTGSLPVSTVNTPGLDLLLNAKHFHFNNNQLSGSISPKLFNSEMVLIHILLDGNKFTGEIPSNLGALTTLEVLRLDRNSLSGPVPSNFNNLTNLIELHLAYNRLTDPIPDLSLLNSLKYVDLSNNSFDESEAPRWFSNLQSLTALVMENGNLQGPLPELLFILPQLHQVKLKNNQFNGSLVLGSNVGQQLELVDLENNDISSTKLSSRYKNVLLLSGNPICDVLYGTVHCKTQHYLTGTASCGSKSCDSYQKLKKPQCCDCAFLYEGTFYFRAPSFTNLSNPTVFHELEMSLWIELSLTRCSVSLQNIFFNRDRYLQIQLDLFPPIGDHFNQTEIQRIGYYLSNQTFKPPVEFGPYYFIASPYAL